MSEENVERAWAQMRASLQYRYSAAFPHNPVPKMYWQADPEALLPLMERAIAAGKPLTVDDLLRAQGLETDPDAIV